MQSPVQNKQSVIQRLMQAQGDLQRMGVTRIGVFGSFRRQEPSPESDVDILVEFSAAEHGFDNFMEVSFFLEKLLGREVDVVTREALSPHIGPRILKEVEYVQGAA